MQYIKETASKWTVKPIERTTDEENMVRLYEPIMSSQALLYDIANCIAIETVLNFKKVPYRIIEKENAQFICSMSSGFVPSIIFGKFVFNDCESIVDFFFNDTESTRKNNHVDLSYKNYINWREISSSIVSSVSTLGLTAGEPSTCSYSSNKDLYLENIILSLIKNLEYIEKYICWIDKETYYGETFPRFSSVYPWPLNYIITYKEYSGIANLLYEKGLYNKRDVMKDDSLINEGVKILKILSLYLNDNSFLTGKKPKGVDCLLFGHLNAILSYRNRSDLFVLQTLARYIWSEEILMKFLKSLRKCVSGIGVTATS